uniref:Uncharacterized protein n=1 Tax=Anguilla anguilla TaxID=7936 RepID=A0A0E9R6U5_ANGAN
MLRICTPSIQLLCHTTATNGSIKNASQLMLIPKAEMTQI